MEYQEIVTAYKKKDLDTSNLRKKLEISKPLKGRERYRAIDIIDSSLSLNNEIIYLLTMPENMDKSDKFLDELDKTLNNYFANLIESVKTCKAWDIIGLIPKGWSQAEFETLSKTNKFKILYDINKKYYKFLEYQKVADIRDSFDGDKELSDDKINKLEFLTQMFDNFKSENIKNDFFCFDKHFLMALINFKKSKVLRIDEYMSTKKKSIQYDYKKYSRFFSTEDFREIIENLTLTSKTLKISLTKTIEYFYEISESEAEKSHIKGDFEDLKKLQKKYVIMNKLKVQSDKIKAIETQKENEKKKIEEEKRKIQEMKKIAEEKAKKEKELKEKAERERVIGKEEGSTEKMAEFINNNSRKVSVKEQVNPIIFSWFDKDDITLARRVGAKNLTEFFNQVKKYELKTGIRASLFLITNTGKEVTLKRLQEFQKKATSQGLPKLVEGALGGYSTFKIDKTGKISDIAQMSDLNRTKIINLLDRPVKNYLSREIVEEDEQNYLRYLFSDRKNKHITMDYLKLVINQILSNEKVKKQPLKFLPFIEKNCSGIDVLLESQLKGISQLPEYYHSKYYIAPGKSIRVDVSNIEEFIGDKTVNENVVEEK